MSSRHRAEPLAPDDRRRAIVEAVIPLFVERGATVTTRQMAEAAGIAEGTIFRVFPDKSALIHEAVRVSVDPGPIQKSLSEIYADAPLETQLAEAARILLERFDIVITLLGVLRTLPHFGIEGKAPGPPAFVTVANGAINQSLSRIFDRHRDRLRIDPARAASAFRGLLLANAHPTMELTERLTVDEIVSVLLTGIVTPVPGEGDLMLIRIVKEYLRPYKRWLAIIVGLQLVGTIASLYLPSLNADIIDQGVVTGDTDYILRVGAVMLGISLVQVGCTDRRRLLRGQDRNGLRARPPFEDLPPGRRVLQPRDGQVRRPLAHHPQHQRRQQVQTLVFMSLTMMLMAPIMMVGGMIMALREDVGLFWLVAVAVPVLG